MLDVLAESFGCLPSALRAEDEVDLVYRSIRLNVQEQIAEDERRRQEALAAGRR